MYDSNYSIWCKKTTAKRENSRRRSRGNNQLKKRVNCVNFASKDLLASIILTGTKKHASKKTGKLINSVRFAIKACCALIHTSTTCTTLCAKESKKRMRRTYSTLGRYKCKNRSKTSNLILQSPYAKNNRHLLMSHQVLPSIFLSIHQGMNSFQ